MKRFRKTVPRLLGAGLAAILAGAPGVPAGAAAAPIRALEQAIETRSGALLLPGGGVGTLTVTPCGSCRPLGLLAGSSTTWVLGGREVGFEELRRALLASPRVPVTVFYDGRNQALTRLVARAGAETPR